MSMDKQPRMNRTGMNLKPGESHKMIDGAMKYPPSSGGDGSVLLQERAVYIGQGEPIGSIPLPITPRGAVETVKGVATGKQPLIFADRLGERLAFERSGTRLYQGFLGKVMSADTPKGSVSAQEVEEILEDEHRHFLMLRRAIEMTGGDPTAVTPAADVIAVQSMGLVQVLSDPRTTVDQCLCALLTAELADNDGWELLIALADGLGHKDLVSEFEEAFANEERHLMLVRSWVQDFAMSEAGITGKSAPKSTRARGTTKGTTTTTTKRTTRSQT